MRACRRRTEGEKEKWHVGKTSQGVAEGRKIGGIGQLAAQASGVKMARLAATIERARILGTVLAPVGACLVPKLIFSNTFWRCCKLPATGNGFCEPRACPWWKATSPCHHAAAYVLQPPHGQRSAGRPTKQLIRPSPAWLRPDSYGALELRLQDAAHGIRSTCLVTGPRHRFPMLPGANSSQSAASGYHRSAIVADPVVWILVQHGTCVLKKKEHKII
jgi:hypothetical protein